MTKVAIPATRLPELVGNGFLNLIIFPTEKCNFRCNYCYEDFKIGRMSESIINGIKTLITKRSNTLETLEISWFGGEPLLAKDVILDISKHANDLAQTSSTFIFQSNITTNGFFLSLETFQQLIECGVSFFQITLDGDKDLHDETANTQCFDRIWSNLVAFRDSDLNGTIELRVHYSPETWLQLKPLINKINQTFASDDRFSVYFKSIEHYGSKNDQSIGIFKIESSRDIKRFLESQLASESLIYKVPYAENFICYAAKATSFGIRADGRLVKCTVALNEPRNHVGEIRPDGTLVINEERTRKWIEGLFTGEKQMLECPNSKMRGYVPSKYSTIKIHEIQSKWQSP